MYLYLSFLVGLIVLMIFLLFVWFYWMDLVVSGLDREVVSCFECGFDGKDLSRLPFSLRFFFIVILFVMFDMEMCLLMQLPYDMLGFLYISRFWYVFFVFLLLIGVVIELFCGLLYWKV